MSVDKFGRYLRNSKSENLRGPKGDGFHLTSDGNFDITNKKLCNVGDPLAGEDAVNLKTLNKCIDGCLVLNNEIYDAKNKIISNVGSALQEHDAVSLSYLSDHALLKNKKDRFDAKALVITNVGSPKRDSDVATVEFVKNNSLLIDIESNDIDAKKGIITNLSKPKRLYDSVNYLCLMEALASLSYVVYTKMNENKKRKSNITKAEWLHKVVYESKDWNDLFTIKTITDQNTV